MIIVPKRKIIILLLFTVLMGIAASTTRQSTPVFSQKLTKRIILDAGHGFPDGGAIGISGTIESTLNLKIALLTEKLLKSKGYTVIMTRTDENSLSNSGETIRSRKKADMQNRLEKVQKSNADMFVSIHMNKFSDSRYRGAQVIYSANYIQSENLAAKLQQYLNELEDNVTKRTSLKAPNNIFLLKNAPIPAVIVECGFLSNFSEEQNLISEKYQKELAGAICEGIENYYKTYRED